MKLPPYPPTPAPPHFGQGSAGQPSVAFQTADTQPGEPAPSRSSVGPDAEETMHPPLPKRHGGPVPNAQNPATTPQDMPGGAAQPHRPQAGPPQGTPHATDIPHATASASTPKASPGTAAVPPQGVPYGTAPHAAAPHAAAPSATAPSAAAPSGTTPHAAAPHAARAGESRGPAPRAGEAAAPAPVAAKPSTDFPPPPLGPPTAGFAAPDAARSSGRAPGAGPGPYGPPTPGTPPYATDTPPYATSAPPYAAGPPPYAAGTPPYATGVTGTAAQPGPPGFGIPRLGDPAPGVPPYGAPAADPIPEAERTVSDDATPRAETPGTATYGPTGTGGAAQDADRPMPPDSVPGSHTPTTPPYGPAGTGTPASDTGRPSATGPGAPDGDTAADGDTGPSTGSDRNADGTTDTETTAAAAGAARTSSPGTPRHGTGGQQATFVNGQATLALARLGAEASSDTPGPELTPDAILPPGISPQAPPEPPHDATATSTGPIPRLGAGPGFPGSPSYPPPPTDGLGGSSGARRALLVGGGLVAALLLGGGGALAVTALSGGSGKDHKVAQTQPPAPTPVQPTPTPTPTHTKAKHKPKRVPVDIRDEKKDPKPLTISEIFPQHTLTLAGHKFTLAKTVINDHCSLAANGPFAQELTREHCRRVVRATFVSDDKKLAVTTGIAVMPTDAAARAVLKLQDPSHYKWFRGMKATGAPKIDQAGGFAASTLRGRYISYAYATYVDGHKPAAKDTTLKTVGTAFRDSTVRPIERRAKH